MRNYAWTSRVFVFVFILFFYELSEIPLYMVKQGLDDLGEGLVWQGDFLAFYSILPAGDLF